MLLVIFCLVTGQSSPSPRILGGTPVDTNEYPWVAFGDAVFEIYETLSEGALIYDYSSAACTSAAQCPIGEPCVMDVLSRQSHCQATWIASTASVLGGFSTSSSGQEIPAFIFGDNNYSSPLATKGVCTELFVHPGFSYDVQVSLAYNDIALCKLGLITTDVTRVQILNAGDDLTYTSGQVAIVAGWGGTSSDEGMQTILNAASLHTSTNTECQADLNARSNITDNYPMSSSQLCAGGATFGDPVGTGPCYGETAAPLFTMFQGSTTPVLLGLDSLGFGTDAIGYCAEGAPDIYTRVSAFKSWITAQQTCSREYHEAGSCMTACVIPTRTGNITCPARGPTTRSPTAKPTTRAPTAKPTTRTPTLRPSRGPTQPPSTRSPTAKPTTRSPTAKPTTRSPTAKPTTRSPTPKPTTRSPTPKPTTRSPTLKPTSRAPTAKPTTRGPTTRVQD